MPSLEDLLVAHGRPLHQAIVLLREGWQEFDDLIRVTAAPRRSIEELQAVLGDDLERDGKLSRIKPGADYTGYGLPEFTEPGGDALVKLEKLIKDVPPPLAALDHVQATPETVLKRALWLRSRYDLGKARLLCLGDHDLTSLAVHLTDPDADITVVDLDERVLDYIDTASGGRVRTLHADLRFGLPPAVSGAMDLVFSDPPYTPEGIGLFAARGVQALREPSDGRLLLAYGYSPRHPALGAQVQRELAILGLTFEAILPDFNRYFGAQAIGSAADLYVCQPTAKAKKARAGKGKAAIYTHGPQSVEAGTTKPALLDRLLEIAGETGLSIESRRVDWSVSGPEGDAVAMDLSADPGPWLLRTLLGTNAQRLALLLPNSHPDLGDAASQAALSSLVAGKYTLRLLRSTPDNKHAVVVADAVSGQNELLSRAHARLANVPQDIPAELHAYRLIDLPRHRIAALLAT
ncbi:Protein of unknown function DUF43 [Amycolatopsis xylanica]|uniref:N(4)-bis(aminopropyl)spermidine synthase C-terminal domain-containing protein n=1 Tax=Amycolatopsis xylanica TaxID=589385 RepID=A0A1H3E4J1_9PSEU|nr:bis-aminopropyl spermidine synthase family protein [Amycolatopsis xylanica]SDX73596.1 Protein of unknown function DUF43 [Amycolatopsis xylanica]